MDVRGGNGGGPGDDGDTLVGVLLPNNNEGEPIRGEPVKLKDGKGVRVTEVAIAFFFPLSLRTGLSPSYRLYQ